MPESPTTTEAIERLSQKGYEFGFVTDIEQENHPAGLERGCRPLDLQQEKRARMAARMAIGGLSLLAGDGRADLGECRVYAG